MQWQHLPGTILTWSLVTSQVTWYAMYSPGGVPLVIRLPFTDCL